MKTEILPCPFCGGETETFADDRHYWRECKSEDCAYKGNKGETVDEAIKRHNVVAGVMGTGGGDE